MVKVGVIRTDKELENTLKSIQKDIMKERGELVSLRRLSKTGARILNRPNIREEIIKAKLDDDRNMPGRKRK